MRITVVKVEPLQDLRHLISFSTYLGDGRAIWEGAIAPQVGGAYDVELHIPEILVWRKNISPCQEMNYLISESDGQMIFCGKIEVAPGDGTLTVRLGDSF